ncbi:serine/threonine-protein kinase [Nonomuraea sp. NPDC050786]|uniref:serine/threonine-protein kinase n=1 Tax=Nonomuraea sp. NPDC050786 TaxID=3154840 RepID=UPI0033FEEACE
MDPLKPSDPRQIGDIVLHGRLGSGGMGQVFYGVTPDSEPVALKVIREEFFDKVEVRERFTREIDALRTVQSPYVAALVDAAEEDADKPWLAVDYVRGLNLREFVDSQQSLGSVDAAALGVVLADALTALHQAGLIHRDLKPANILMSVDGPKVIDLGLVAFTEGPTDLTTDTSMLGTPVCMAPEQVTAPTQVTVAADIHALGATLLFALTKHYPYDGRPNRDKMLIDLTNPEVAPDLSGLPDGFESIIAAMLAHDPAARPDIPRVRAWLSDLATADGITLAVAVRHLAVTTYIVRDTDPPEVDPPLPKRRDLTEVVVPGSVVALLAERLRGTYACNAPF